MLQHTNAKISQTIKFGWKVFVTIKKIEKILRDNVFWSIILLTMLFTSEAWATVKKDDQWDMEWSMLELSLHNHIRK